VALDPALLEILRCPDEHHALLEYDEAAQTLTCVECHRIFEIRDGIPVLLLDEARRPAGGADGAAAGADGATAGADGAVAGADGADGDGPLNPAEPR
jgi:uncharacterized protein